MIRYATIATNLGPISLACTDLGLCNLAFGAVETTWREQLGEAWQQPVQRDQASLAQAIDQLRQYLVGARRTFDLPLDLSQGTAFQQAVWRAIMTIPYGQVRSYGQVAQMIEQPRATRAVGGALGNNPLPVIVPCHRVVAADGSLGGFSIGLPLKRALLRIEGNPLGDMDAETARLPGLGEP